MNQIEFQPYALAHYTPTLLPLCNDNGILIECFGPLMSLVRHTGGPVDHGPVDHVVDRVVSERGVEGETGDRCCYGLNR